MKSDILCADKSVSTQKEDRFQRYPFAKRIADTIIESKSTEGIIIGIYGAWGEGKTSVMDFIATELQTHDSIIRLKFNPWRYPNESSLLFNFFLDVAKVLDVKVLKTRERFGRWTTKHKNILDLDIPKIGIFSKTVSAFGSILGSVELEDLKKRLKESLLKGGKKLVIFIDDIDRLDKDEIHAVFRLVKLTADFPNTTYILAFDNRVVSSILAERYAKDDSTSGVSFLEKIIQVPLTLPKAQSQALREYCFSHINDAFNNNNLELPDGEAQRFVNVFTPSLLPHFKTPRMIVRYGNLLSFALPLLHKEANSVDLMLLEAIKVLFPELYDFIKDNPQYFVGLTRDSLSSTSPEDQKELMKKDIDLVITKTGANKESILQLLKELFPRVKWAYSNYVLSDKTFDQLYKGKRIASSKYFHRYFSYCVLSGELSDASFEDFKNAIPTLSYPDTKTAIEELINASSPDEFIYGLRSIEDELEWDNYVKLAVTLSEISDTFPVNYRATLFGMNSPQKQLLAFLTNKLRNCSHSHYPFDLAYEIINKGKPTDFVIEFFRLVMSEDSSGNTTMDAEQRKKLTLTLKDRVLQESGEQPIFEAFHDEARIIMHYWKQYDSSDFERYISLNLTNNPQKCTSLLKVYLTKLRALGSDKWKIENMDEKNYKYLTSILDKDVVYNALLQTYPEDELRKEDDLWAKREDAEPSDIAIARQYYHWYNQDSSN